VKAQWGRLSGDHGEAIAGKGEEVVGKIQETYGVAKDEAKEQIKRVEK
jgi:uncharacterized protein YjbJ (UPF0337 family)